MYDGARIEIDLAHPIHITKGVGCHDLDTGESLCDFSKDRNLNIKLGKNGYKLTIDGSFHRYYQSANTGIYSFIDFCKTVDTILSRYGAEAHQASVKRLEFGVNIPIEHPRSIIDAAISFDRVRASKTFCRDEFYGKIWEFSEYWVKLYEKTPFSLRFEVKYLRRRCFGSLGISTLADTVDINKSIELAANVVNQLNRFLFVPEDVENKLPIEWRDHWYRYRLDGYWSHMSKDKRYLESKKVKKLILEHSLADYCSILTDRAIRVLAEEFNVDQQIFISTKSSLGLHEDLVAPNGGRDLIGNQTDDYVESTTNSIHPDGGISIYTFQNNHILPDRHHLSESLYRHAGDYGRRVTGCHIARAPPATFYKTNVLCTKGDLFAGALKKRNILSIKLYIYQSSKSLT